MITIKDFELLMLKAGEAAGCDKVNPHFYHRYYASHLCAFYGRPFKLLEIGIGGEGRELGGASLKMWKSIFPEAQIFAWDIYPKQELDDDRVKTYIVDQGDVEAIRAFCAEHGPFDIIIDDGSHHRSDQLTSLFNLINEVSDGGMYVIEDYFTAYWPVYEGSTLAVEFLDSPIRWIKRSVDIVNRGNLLSPEVQNLLPDWGIESLHVYPGVCVFRKKTSGVESSIPSEEFRQNQIELDGLRYGRYQELFIEFMKDPMKHLEELVRLRSHDK
jgi:hypothetical protein